MRKWTGSTHSRQRGTAAIEFAFVFPLLFCVTYASIVYGFIYFAQQTVNFAAEEAARFAIASATPGSSNLCSDLKAAATKSFTDAQALQPVLATATLNPICPAPGTASATTLQVMISLPTATFTASGAGFAQVTFPGLGPFPPVPMTLSGNAVVSIN